MQLTFVIVDDDENSLEVAEMALQHRYHDAEFHIARNGGECLDILRHVVPDLIVMDLSMPGMDGWQTLMSIRRNPALTSVPVIAMTAYDSSNVADDAIEAGFVAYFPKPIDVAMLNQTLRQLVG